MVPVLIATAPAFVSCDGLQIDRTLCAGNVTLDSMTRYTLWVYPRGVDARDDGPGDPIVSVVWGCVADTNQDGVVDGLDFGAWLGYFNAKHPLADSNLDGVVDGADYGAWLSSFNGGCE